MKTGENSRWVHFDPMHRITQPIPAEGGVYAIYLDDELVYIGQSNNLRARLSRHAFRYGYAQNVITPWGTFPDSVTVRGKYSLARRYGDWAMREIRLIRRLRPKFNGTFTGVRAQEAAR